MPPLSRNIKAGLGVIAAGLCTGFLMYLHPEKLRVPAWLGYAACAVFVVSGVALIAKEYQSARAADGFAVAILSGMLLITGWIALGPGERRCFLRSSGLFGISPGLCRGAFGLAASILVVLLIIAVRRFLSKHRTI